MRYVLAAFLAAHGIAHLVGFVVPWRLMTAADLPYKTTIFAGRVDLGADGIRMIGLLWLATAVAFLAASVTWALDLRSAFVLLAVAVAASTMLCVVDWPEARIGLLVNVAILAALVAATRAGMQLRS